MNTFELARIFFALALLLISAHSFGYLFSHFKLPKVVGEIVGGLVLGPTILGFFLPSIYNGIFNAFPTEAQLISFLYWMGLTILMFVSGFEVQKSISRSDSKIILAILLGSTIIPFAAGWLAPSFYDFSKYLGPANNMLALQIIIAIAVAVTSIPVISKIFMDLKVMDSRFAKIVLATATIHDVLLWVALAVATGLIAHNEFSFSSIFLNIAITLAFFIIAILAVPKILKFINSFRTNLLVRSSVSGYILFICFIFAAVASLLDVNIVFGALLAGMAVGMVPDEKFIKAREHIKEIGLSFFIPVYFAIVGLKLDLIQYFDPIFFFGFLIFTTFFQLLGTIIACRFLRIDWRSSFNFGVAMSTRGGPGIVLATVAFDLGIINENFFSTLVLIAIVTSLLAGLWFRFTLERGYSLLRE